MPKDSLISKTELPSCLLGFSIWLMGLSPPIKALYLELEFQELTSVTTSQSQVEFLSSVMLMVLVEGGI